MRVTLLQLICLSEPVGRSFTGMTRGHGVYWAALPLGPRKGTSLPAGTSPCWRQTSAESPQGTRQATFRSSPGPLSGPSRRKSLSRNYCAESASHPAGGGSMAGMTELYARFPLVSIDHRRIFWA